MVQMGFISFWSNYFLFKVNQRWGFHLCLGLFLAWFLPGQSFWWRSRWFLCQGRRSRAELNHWGCLFAYIRHRRSGLVSLLLFIRSPLILSDYQLNTFVDQPFRHMLRFICSHRFWAFRHIRPLDLDSTSANYNFLDFTESAPRVLSRMRYAAFWTTFVA